MFLLSFISINSFPKLYKIDKILDIPIQMLNPIEYHLLKSYSRLISKLIFSVELGAAFNELIYSLRVFE